MDYLNMSCQEIYNQLDMEDKVITDYFLNYPNIDSNKLLSIGLNVPDNMVVCGNVKNDWEKIVDYSLSLLHSEIEQRKQARIGNYEKNYIEYNLNNKGIERDELLSIDEKYHLARIKSMRDVYKFAILKDEREKDRALLWYLSKSDKFSINPKQYRNLFNGYFSKTNGQELLLIPFSKQLLSKCKTPAYEMAYYKQMLMDKLINYPELSKQTFEIYKSAKSVGFLDINAIEAKTKGNINDLNGSWNGQQQLMLHLAIKGLPKTKPLLDLLFEFEDLDVNARNPVIIINYLSAKNNENESDGHDISKNNTPLMQIFRMSETIDKTLANEVIDKLIECGAWLDVKNYRGESAIMTAIHHGCEYGVEKLKHLIYPEILKDMEKLQGFCEWSTITPNISKILSNRYPDMVDANNQTYSQYINQVKSQLSCSQFLEFNKLYKDRKIAKNINPDIKFCDDVVGDIPNYTRRVKDNIVDLFEKCELGDIHYNAWKYRRNNKITDPTEEVVWASVENEYRTLLLIEKAILPERYAKHLKELQDKIGPFKENYFNPDIPF